MKNKNVSPNSDVKKISFGPGCGPPDEEESEEEEFKSAQSGQLVSSTSSSSAQSQEVVAAPPLVSPQVYGIPAKATNSLGLCGTSSSRGESNLYTASRTVPYMASGCFLLVATGVALAYHAALDIDEALKEFGDGGEELRRYSTKHLSISLGVAAVVNWTALLQNFLASGRTRELLFTKTPQEVIEKDHAFCPQCCMKWYIVRPTQLILFFSFLVQLSMAFMDVIVAGIVVAMAAVCKAGKPATKSFQNLIDILFDKGKEEPGFSWKWASTFNAEEYCDRISDMDRAAKQLVLSCFAIVIGQGAMMSCLSWSRERVRSQIMMPPEDCIGFITTDELEQQAKRMTEIHAVAAAQQVQAKELVERERRRTKEFSRMSQRKIEEMAIEIEELQETLVDHGIRPPDEEDEEEESEDEDADSGELTDAASEEDTEDPRAPLHISDEFDLNMKDGALIPSGQEIALEDAKANVGLCSLWCSRGRC